MRKNHFQFFFENNHYETRCIRTVHETSTGMCAGLLSEYASSVAHSLFFSQNFTDFYNFTCVYFETPCILSHKFFDGWQFAHWLNFWMQKDVHISVEKRKESHHVVAGNCQLYSQWIIVHNFSDLNIMFNEKNCLDLHLSWLSYSYLLIVITYTYNCIFTCNQH